MPLPKAASRKNSNGRRGKTRTYTDTPVRDKAEKSKHRKDLKNQLIVEKVLKENCIPKKALLVISSSSTNEKDIELIYNDDSDCEFKGKIEIKLGNYAVALVAEKSRSLKFIARIDNYDEDDCEYEGVFLKKVNSKTDSGMNVKGHIFVVNEKMLLHLPLVTLC